ncbi:hypothetical protein KIN20_002980 [Parelaphostrongylus tenuis]|uniref:Uncharacterized protein n=1 Tax=Parelaphostrongylus tenuis TaxID=148309 RepID=A0AAD5QFR0_PARTN|nr:hypothetical protein KIN20_002980 [Parelaphostrongylus tenuis]
MLANALSNEDNGTIAREKIDGCARCSRINDISDSSTLPKPFEDKSITGCRPIASIVGFDILFRDNPTRT